MIRVDRSRGMIWGNDKKKAQNYRGKTLRKNRTSGVQAKLKNNTKIDFE
jgi:hypothetical protein